MFSKIKNIFNKRKMVADKPLSTHTPRADGFQLATLSDSNVIFDMIISEAKNRHFNNTYTLSVNHPPLKHQIKETIKSRKCPFNGVTYDSNMYVFIENDQAIAFSWILKKKLTEIELYLMAVLPEKRNKGIGKTITIESINKFAKGTKFIVRLYEASKTMLKIVRAIGFKPAPIQARDTKTLSFIS